MMMDWGVKHADSSGLISYVQATKEGRPLYAKFGFKVVETHVADLSKWGGPSRDETPIMIRKGQTKPQE